MAATPPPMVSPMHRIMLAAVACCICLVSQIGHAQKTYHVAVNGNDRNDGSTSRPFKTISQAAALAQPGDVITVHAGIYRERIAPPRGGTSDAKRIVYQAARGEIAEIRGSEVIKSWQNVHDDSWKVVLPNTFFGTFNPYLDLIHGDWYDDEERQHHTGQVYLDGKGMVEAARFEQVLQPVGDSTLWYGYVNGDSTTIVAQFKGVDPNEHLVEINARQSVFYPDKPGMNYITVRGFVMKHAASQWAPPTAEQIGLIGTHWSKGWVIENNTISDAKNVCITLGKYGDEFDNKAGSAQGYIGTIHRAIANGWSKENIGHHVVQNNAIFECGQAGIVGSLGAVFSTIANNDIHDIHLHQLYSGAEVAGIKLHGAVDVTISNNHIYKTVMGIWLDWMAQGTRVERNLLHDNVQQDMFIEVDHGPYLIDNNIFLSKVFLFDDSEGGAIVHNVIAGYIRGANADGRTTPYFKPHTVDLVGLASVSGGDMRFYNNIFMHRNALNAYKTAKLPVVIDGNAFLTTVDSVVKGGSWLNKPDGTPALTLTYTDGKYTLGITPEASFAADTTRHMVTTALLGRARVPNQAFENTDGSPLVIDRTYFGKQRKQRNPSPGPFELPETGNIVLTVWPQ